LESLDKYEKEAARNWDKFYLHNTTNFFKDRHWIIREFPELSPASQVKMVIEIGCGVGNTVFPILEENPNLFFYALDFSPRAIKLLQENPKYEAKRCMALVCDIIKDDIPHSVPSGTLDCAVIIFVLSAMAPEKMPIIVTKLWNVLKEGGLVLIRDYAVNDLAQIRFEKDPSNKKLSDNFYVRQDGTRAYFFNTETLAAMFTSQGFEVVDNRYIKKQKQNIKMNITMDRMWIQAKFKKVPRNT